VRRIIVGVALLAVPAVALAQSSEPGIDVVSVSGPLDGSTLDFMADSIANAVDRGQALLVFEIDSPAALDRARLSAISEIIANPPLPVAVWVGPAPAAALGGAAQLVLGSPQKAVAPGSVIGLVTPTVAGDESAAPIVADELLDGFEGRVEADGSGLELQPSIRQYLQELNGRTFPTRDGPTTVTTIREFTQDGETGVTVLPVTFIKPGLVDRFFRLGVSPEAAFFFLAIGLAIITFEFFAIGPGLAAATGAISLTIAGWGLTNLPSQWWSVALVVAGWLILTASYQRGGVIALTLLGASAMQVGGMLLVDGSGQVDPRWWLILPSVLAVLFFFLLAMPTVQRARFSTQVLGRDSLVGARGVALVDFDPDGLVEVNGGRWRATAHREAGLVVGSKITVTGVDGLFLEVGPESEERDI
jgi:membrane-bound serine protease (ClpP class)